MGSWRQSRRFASGEQGDDGETGGRRAVSSARARRKHFLLTHSCATTLVRIYEVCTVVEGGGSRIASREGFDTPASIRSKRRHCLPFFFPLSRIVLLSVTGDILAFVLSFQCLQFCPSFDTSRKPLSLLHSCTQVPGGKPLGNTVGGPI